MTRDQRAIPRNQAQSPGKKPRPYHRVKAGVRAEIERQARKPVPPTAKEIQETLELDERFADHVPPLRTLQAIAKAAAVIDGSAPWRIGQGAGLNAGPVLDVLTEVIDRTEGGRTYVTRNEAHWIVRISRARPDIDPWLAYQTARHMLASSETESAAIEAYIAYRPWAAEHRVRYENAIDRGWIQRWVGDTYVRPPPAALTITTFAPAVEVRKAK